MVLPGRGLGAAGSAAVPARCARRAVLPHRLSPGSFAPFFSLRTGVRVGCSPAARLPRFGMFSHPHPHTPLAHSEVCIQRTALRLEKPDAGRRAPRGSPAACSPDLAVQASPRRLQKDSAATLSHQEPGESAEQTTWFWPPRLVGHKEASRPHSLFGAGHSLLEVHLHPGTRCQTPASQGLKVRWKKAKKGGFMISGLGETLEVKTRPPSFPPGD